MTKIAHIADTHIRNLKYHHEYRIVFAQIYETLKNEKVDYIVHCGDIAHTKTQISPEFVEMAGNFFYNLAEIAPTYIILGNHDGNLKNSSRQDAISPIINALAHPNLHLLKDSGEHVIGKNLCLNVLSVFDEENWIKPTNKKRVNIALYHGAVINSRTDAGFKMTHGDHDISIFDDFDYAMLGDIHQSQILDNEGRVRYAGSTIQQNFGETDDKGLLIWKITGKKRFKVEKKVFKNPRPFISWKIQLDAKGNVDISNFNPPEGARVRLIADASLSIEVVKKATELVNHKFKPESITFLNRATQRSSIDVEDSDAEKLDLRKISVQEDLIEEYLDPYNLSQEQLDNVLRLNKKYNDAVTETEDVSRNVNWSLDRIYWDNLFNYGEDNEINFQNLSGIVGIFGKNFSGKSSIIDSTLYALFNSTSKNERKNLNVINQNKDKCFAKLQLSIGDVSYTIERESEKYRKRLKGVETLEAKTNVAFSAEDKATGEVEPLNGLTRSDTDKIIRNHFGSLEDFLLTSMSSQNGALNFISEGASRRKEIFAKFLDLNLFESKYRLAKEDSAEVRALLRKGEGRDFQQEIKDLAIQTAKLDRKLNGHEEDCKNLGNQVVLTTEEIAKITSKIESIPAKIIDIAKVRNKIVTKKASMAQINAHMSELKVEKQESKALYEKLSVFVNSFPIDTLREEKEEIDKLSSEMDLLSSEISIKRKDYKQNASRKKLLEGIPCGTQFPKCKFIRDANISVMHMPVIQKEIDECNASMDNLKMRLGEMDPDRVNTHLEKFQLVLDRKVKLSSRITEIELQLERDASTLKLLKKEIEELGKEEKVYDENREAIENLEQLVAQRKTLEGTLKSVKRSLAKCEKDKLQFYKQVGSLEEKTKTVEAEKESYTQLQEDYSAYDLYMTCMHPNGIAFDIIKKKLPVINDEIAKTISNIVDFEIFFEIDGSKFDIFIKHPSYGARPLEMGSGAEKTIAAMAIRMALLTVSSMPKGDIFILDEPGTALDEENMEGFIRMLELIKVNFNTVLLISHLDSLKDCVDMQIVIDKKDGYAQVKQ